MKKLFIIIALVITSAAYAQKDSLVKPTDSTALFTIQDLQPIYDELKKRPYEEVAHLMKYLEELTATRAKEYYLNSRKRKQ